METINDIIGRNIRRLRKGKKWTQIKLGQLIGCNSSSISQWEYGKFSPNAYYLDRLAAAFECSMDELFKRREA